MNDLLLFGINTVYGGNDIVTLLVVAIVVGAIWYIFNLAPVPAIVKQVVGVIACAALLIFAIKFLVGLI